MKPHRSKLFYVPQRPYMTLGTLRDQVIYPHSKEDQRRKGVTDDALEEFLSKVSVCCSRFLNQPGLSCLVDS